MRTAATTALVRAALLLALFGSPRLLVAQAGTLFLVGDAGQVNPARARVLAHLGASVDSLLLQDPDHPVAVVFLGDNVYEAGVRAKHFDQDAAILTDQVTLGGHQTAPSVYFVPGNHDWANGASDAEGRLRLQLQDSAIREIARRWDKKAQLHPASGCLGPVTLPLGNAARLVLFDSELLLRGGDPCDGVTREEFHAALTSTLSQSLDRPVILLAHHPLATGGPHGGHGGGLHALVSRLGLSQQSLGSGRYRRMIESLTEAIASSGHPAVVYAAGHEHNLQVIDLETRDGELINLVSGSGSKLSRADSISGSRFWAAAHGYMRLDFGGAGPILTIARLSEDDTVGLHLTTLPLVVRNPGGPGPGPGR